VRGAVYACFAHLRASSMLGLPDWYKRGLGLSNGRESKGMVRGEGRWGVQDTRQS
jgi:hypothetical protein